MPTQGDDDESWLRAAARAPEWAPRPQRSELLSRAEARIGTILRGKYRLDRVLGAGGMAVVYGATHRNSAEFAIKMLHPEISLNEDIRARFLREGYAANSIKHAGAVAVVDDDVSEEGAAFLVMELLDGVGCDELWERSGRRLSVPLAVALTIQLLDVLSAAHGKGTIHRDIKPANLFLTRTGLVKVLDFGIARTRDAIAGAAHVTATGAMLGTPAFMAPEQARGKTAEIDGRSDVWAVGATLFSLVSGAFVHTGETGAELAIHAATQPARPLAQVAEVPRALANIVDRALGFRPEDRWPTAGAMRSALLDANLLEARTPESLVAAAVPAAVRGSSPPLALAETVAAPLPDRARTESEKGARAISAPLTTSAPMSSDREPGQPRSVFAWVALPAVLVLVGVAGRLVWPRQQPEPNGAHAPMGADTQAKPIPSTPGPVSDASPARQTVSVVAAPPFDAGLPRVAPTPRPRPQPKPMAVPVASAHPDCETKFTLDEQGHKHWKPECFLNQ